MIVHLQPVDTYFTCKLCRLYTSKTIPEMNRSWENSLFSNVGDRSFSVSCGWGGGSSQLFWDTTKGGHPPKILWWRWGFIIFFKSHRRSPPPPHKKWTVPEWSKSKTSLKTQKHVPNYKSVGKAIFFIPSFLQPMAQCWTKLNLHMCVIFARNTLFCF